MVPNLTSARQAIEAELSHARQGIAYYSARVEALEIALHQLENVEDIGENTPGSTMLQGNAGRRKNVRGGRVAKARGVAGTNGARQASAEKGSSRQQGQQTKRGAKARSVKTTNGAGTLPQTGAEFWFNLVSDQPQSAVDIANAAIATLDIKPDQKTEIQKLKQRVSPALAGLVATQKIRDSGAGRERRFFKS